MNEKEGMMMQGRDLNNVRGCVGLVEGWEGIYVHLLQRNHRLLKTLDRGAGTSSRECRNDQLLVRPRVRDPDLYATIGVMLGMKRSECEKWLS